MSTYRRDRRRVRRSIHPIWRGIGCTLLILVPITSFTIAQPLLDWVEAKDPALEKMLSANTSVLNNPLVLKVAIALLLTMAIFLVLSIFWSLLNSLVGPDDEEIDARGPSAFRR